MEDVLKALETNNTWEIVDLPLRVKPLGSKWIYKLKKKKKQDETIDRYKARVVIKEYNHREGLDYLDTFNPFTKMTTIRFLLALHPFLTSIFTNLTSTIPFYIETYMRMST